jgi:hypothetical protein
MRNHGLAIVRDQDSAGLRGLREDFRISHTDDTANACVLDIDCRFPAFQTSNDLVVEVRVCLKARSRALGLGVPWRAASNSA